MKTVMSGIDQQPGNLRRWRSYFYRIGVNRITGVKEMTWKKIIEFELYVE